MGNSFGEANNVHSSVMSILPLDVASIKENITLSTDKDRREIDKTISQIMSYPMDNVLKRYMKDNSISAERAAIHERELKRFLAICVVYKEPIGMRGEVDELWHNFIMFTDDYASFCDEVAGHFIHHVPDDEETTKEESLTSSLRFDMAYENLFNAAPSREVWPNIDVDCRTCANGCVGRCGKLEKADITRGDYFKQ